MKWNFFKKRSQKEFEGVFEKDEVVELWECKNKFLVPYQFQNSKLIAWFEKKLFINGLWETPRDNQLIWNLWKLAFWELA